MSGKAGAAPVRLATTVYGEAEGPPLVIAHGLFGSGRNWGVIARRLGEARRVITVDMRNHGASPWAESHGYEDMAADLAAVIEDAGGEADVLGHSMGGKAAMMLALTRGDLVRRLIVADIAPVEYGHSQMPYLEAMRDMDLSGLGSRTEADARLAEAVDDKAIRAFLLQSLDVTAGEWRLNLAALEAEMPRIMGFPEMTGTWDGPVLLLRGGASDYVEESGVAAARRLFPAVEVETVEGAGHWLHAEKPREVVCLINLRLSDL